MAQVIDYYFAVISGYAYLGEPRLAGMAKAAGVRVAYKPVAIGKVFEAAGVAPPFKQSAARLDYRRKDMARWGRHLGLAVNEAPAFWPADVRPASLAVIAAEATPQGAGPLAFALMRGVWAEEANIADMATIAGIGARAGYDAEALAEAAATPEIAAQFEANTTEAIARGVIGSPTYFFGDDMFFGQDRLHFVEAALR